MYGEVLDVILRFMESKYGVFGYLDESGALVIPSLSKEVWDQCRMGGKTVVFPPETWAGLWGRALREKKSFCSNEPLRVPEGHIQIDRFLTTPIIYRKEVIGLLSVGRQRARLWGG